MLPNKTDKNNPKISSGQCCQLNRTHTRPQPQTSAGSHVCSNFDSDQKLWWKPYQIGMPNKQTKQTNKREKPNKPTKTKTLNMQCTADRSARARAWFGDGWQPWSRSCQKCDQRIQIKGVQRAWTRSEPSKPHILKEVNFRRTLWKETIGTGNQIFTINLDNFVN